MTYTLPGESGAQDWEWAAGLAAYRSLLGKHGDRVCSGENRSMKMGEQFVCSVGDLGGIGECHV